MAELSALFGLPQTATVEELRRRAALKFNHYFPDCTDRCQRDSTNPLDHVEIDGSPRFCRKGYHKHIVWMHAGSAYPERLFLAANQIGKTEAAAFEVTCHLTGLYPHWWEGKRFPKATEWWLAGDTMLSTRNVLQVAMMGKIEGVETETWTGMLPDHLVHDYTRKSGGVSLCIDKVWVRHHDADGEFDGTYSTLEFLSYDQGRKVFQGTGRDGIWLDEEPPDPPRDVESGESNDIYSECLLRTITRDGIVIATFTPLRGLTPFVQRYLDDAVMPGTEGELLPANKVMWDADSQQAQDAATRAADADREQPKVITRFIQGATWDDAPHLSEKRKAQLWASIPVWARDARAKGIPQLGAGAVFPFPESHVKVPDYEPAPGKTGYPRHWRRGFGMDTALSGTTAIVWAYMDPETQVVTIYAVYKRSQAETAVHAQALKDRGLWIPGVGDAAGVVDHDRTRFVDRYRQHGIDLELPDKSVESGVQDVYDAISQGRLKVHASCAAWFAEFRVYRRDEKGRIVKHNDHLMDATRYLIRSGIQRMKVQPEDPVPEERYRQFEEGSSASLGWMG